jgi:hypothetical protein
VAELFWSGDFGDAVQCTADWQTAVISFDADGL